MIGLRKAAAFYRGYYFKHAAELNYNFNIYLIPIFTKKINKMGKNNNLTIFRLNTKLFINCIEGITEEQSNATISSDTNSIKWVAAHIIWARYNASSIMGNPPANNPYIGLFEDFRPTNKEDDYKTITEIKEEWKKASDLLENSFSKIEPDFWEKEAPIKFPLLGDDSNAGLITFFAQHESFHLGQLAILKKAIVGISMKYQ